MSLVIKHAGNFGPKVIFLDKSKHLIEAGDSSLSLDGDDSGRHRGDKSIYKKEEQKVKQGIYMSKLGEVKENSTLRSGPPSVAFEMQGIHGLKIFFAFLPFPNIDYVPHLPGFFLLCGLMGLYVGH